MYALGLLITQLLDLVVLVFGVRTLEENHL
jgi:hypothetical protein